MRDYLTIGSSPVAEECAQVDSDNYYERAKKECKAFKNQLRRQFGPEPSGCYLTTKSFPHDFGNYMEVCVVFEDSIEEAVEYAFKLEAETPEYWDELARTELNFVEKQS